MATQNITPSAASSPTSPPRFSNTITTLRHWVECLQEPPPYRRRSISLDQNPPSTHTTTDHSMPNVVQPNEDSRSSLDSIERCTVSSSVSDASECGHTDNDEPNDTKTYRQSRKDTFDPLDETCSQSLRPVEPVKVGKTLVDEKDIGIIPIVTVSSPASSSTSLLPTKNTRRQRLKRLCLHYFTAYRILMGLIITVNVVVFIGFNEKAPYERFILSGPLTATAANLFAAVLVRQEDLINVTFSSIAKLPLGLPFWLRRMISDIHHYGGVHIGCAITSLLWYFYFVFLNTQFFLDTLRQDKVTGWMWADIFTCYAFLLSIFVICVLAHPRLRAKLHNTFEHTHRFGGWTALLVLWLNSGVAGHTTGSPPLYANPAIWLLASTTFLIILPWTRIRRVPITTEPVSDTELKVTFAYQDMPYTSTARFSRSPLLEWHAFATIPIPSSSTPTIASGYVLISRAGDWTKAIIESPPTHIWLRKPATKNFLTFAPLFNSLLLVGTGAGIGPLLSLLSSPIIAHMRQQGKLVKVIWSVRDPDAPHWQFVQDIIRRVDPEPRIFNSLIGRPDIAVETAQMKLEHGLEAVMVVSNPTVTRLVVEHIKWEGGAAYGAVFDS